MDFDFSNQSFLSKFAKDCNRDIGPHEPNFTWNVDIMWCIYVYIYILTCQYDWVNQTCTAIETGLSCCELLRLVILEAQCCCLEQGRSLSLKDQEMSGVFLTHAVHIYLICCCCLLLTWCLHGANSQAFSESTCESGCPCNQRAPQDVSFLSFVGV